MTIYSNVKDTTMAQKSIGPGMSFRKKCSSCQQAREIRGGSVYSRLKLWRCASCTEKARAT
jgi:hypothetical protein